MKKISKIMIGIIIIIIICISTIIVVKKNSKEINTIKSEKQLMKIYEGKDDSSDAKDIVLRILTMPFSLITNITEPHYATGAITNGGIYEDFNISISPDSIESSSSTTSSSNKKDYSTTNIQVENVDEADITKTDGDYIYSLSGNDVVITDVRNPNEIKIAAKINNTDGTIPEDLLLYKDKLVVILEKNNNSSWNSYSYYYENKNDTIVKIYDIAKREEPKLIKKYKMYEPYYTSRCINNQLYIISSGDLRKEDNKIITYYEEDGEEKEIGLKNIKYLKDVNTKKQTLISNLNMDNPRDDVKINSYLIDISNAYVSEKNIYLLNEKYEYQDNIPIKSIFGLKGIFGAFEQDYYGDSSYYTDIYKFSIEKNGEIDYKTKTKLEGRTINQYSLDEKNGHIRIALYKDEGTRIEILGDNLEEIGKTKNVARGEKMYSSRFIGDKAYLVTYKTMDPLFVIDLSEEQHPKVLGELEIPGYSTYLHPYDENHIIGIGMETKEEVIRNQYTGKIISTTSRIVGMKMALFDISNVDSPIQISNTVIGDERTTSAILTNPKALLFSKEKELIAIPVNKYNEDFSISSSSDSYENIDSVYAKYDKPYIGEGYFVYNINVKDGFKLKGIINHEKDISTAYGKNATNLLRGLYINDDLYTVSETKIQVHKLEDLKLIKELKIKED